MKIRITAAAAALGLVFAGAALAQSGTIQRDVNQQRRIEQGVASGELTNREAAKLEAGQARDSRVEARAGADGHVSAAEQRRVQRSENRQSSRIYKEKHDAQQR
jgi:hypothetical protein